MHSCTKYLGGHSDVVGGAVLTSNPELAERLGVRVRDVVDDLEHIRRSLGDRELLVEPAVCLKCNYTFDDRRRLTRPSRCPSCRKERITWPVLRIE